MRMFPFRTPVFALVAISPFVLLAHPGGVDKNGGHRDNSTGTYHYHRTANSAKSLVGGKIPGMGPQQGSTVPASRPAVPQRSTSSRSVSGAADATKIERPNMVAMVDSVIDGDTIVVRSGSTKTMIRLEGVDAPELKQPGGKESREALLELVSGKIVQVFGRDRDQEDRVVARIEVRGQNICLEQVRAGHAWKDPKMIITLEDTGNRDEELKQAEAEAKSEKRGLWAGAAPMAPWDFRAKTTPAAK